MKKISLWVWFVALVIGFLLGTTSYAADIDNCPEGYICFIDWNGDGVVYVEDENGEIDDIYYDLIQWLSWFKLVSDHVKQDEDDEDEILSLDEEDDLDDFQPSGTDTMSWWTELERAIRWGHQNGLTMFTTIDTFMWENAVLREDASKLLYQAARTLWYTDDDFDECEFSDIASVSESLKENIQQACKAWGLMKWDAWEFFPLRQLTKAEALTVIARIIGIKDTTTTSTWRAPYRDYIQQFDITEGLRIDESVMDDAISRSELIILLYRTAEIYDNYYGDFSGALYDPNNLTPGTSDSSVSVGAWIVDTPRFTNALLWMYNNDMTMFSDASDFKPYDIITREQSAKLLSIYHDKFIPTKSQEKVTCEYTDITSDLRDYIVNVCEYGIFPNTSLFNPEKLITKSEFIAATLRMQGKITGEKSQKDIIRIALEEDLISAKDLSTFEKPITRYEAALVLHTLYLKQLFVKSLNEAGSIYYVVSPVSDTQSTQADEDTKKYFIDVMSIDSKDFNNWYISLSNKTYKLHKKETISYFPTSYLWYWTLRDINTDKSVWTVGLAIGQRAGAKIVVEWYINLNNNTDLYTINPAETIPYYIIDKIN